MKLEDTTWRLAGWDADAGPAPALPDAPVTLAFSADGAGVGKVSGSGGCNRFTGRYTVAGDRLSIGPVASTRMLCPEPGVMERERRFFEALQAAERFELRGGLLVLAHPGGSLRLIPGE